MPGRGPPRRFGGDRLVAGIAEDHLQRPQDLRLVVAGEDPRAARSPLLPARHRDDEAAALADHRVDRDLAAVGLDEALGDRQAQAGATAAPPSPCWNGSKIRCHSLSGIPGPWSTTRTVILSARGIDLTSTGLPPPWRTAFSSRLAKARSSWAASASTSGSSGSIASRTTSARRSPARAASSTSARSTGSLWGCALPASSRDMSSRFSTRRESRSPSETTAALSSAALLAGRGRRAERRAAGDDRGQRRAQVV